MEHIFKTPGFEANENLVVMVTCDELVMGDILCRYEDWLMHSFIKTGSFLYKMGSKYKDFFQMITMNAAEQIQ